MATTPIQQQDLQDYASAQSGNFTRLSYINVPFTTITNRAKCVDFANDHMPKFGINRIMTPAIQEVQGEFGPNGERVFKPMNDQFERIRFVGNWSNLVDVAGQRLTADSSTSNFIEITFYGTGINLLHLVGFSYDFRVSTDGGAESANIVPTGASILASRNYSSNQVLSAISGLTLGTHTVKLRQGGSTGGAVFGFEILNTTSTLQYVPGTTYAGGKRYSKSALSTDTYNSNFESGTLGTKGGRVVVYQKADGTIKKAVTPTDTTALYLTSASHANESLIRTYHWREFGAGRADDFSMFSSGSATQLAFTLDDGVTTLIGKDVKYLNSDLLNGSGSGSAFTTFTFVGTGLDATIYSDAGGAATAFVDGTSVGTIGINLGSPSNNGTVLVKICSGLPHGTHVVKFATGAGNISFRHFMVYGPAKPTLPSNSVELSDYYLMANYVANATAAIDTIGTGMLRKSLSREFVYSGTWSFGLSPNSYPGGWETNTGTVGGFISYTFYGTGVDLRIGANAGHASNCSVQFNNLAATTANFPSLVASMYGAGGSFSSGILNQVNGSPVLAGLSLSGLPLGLYTVKITNNSGGAMVFHGIDIITPVHSPKSNGPGLLQNTLPVGSQGLGDSRLFGANQVKPLNNWAQAVGVSVTPSTASATYVPVPDMSATIKTNGNPISISYALSLYHSVANTSTFCQVFVDGVAIGVEKSANSPGAGSTFRFELSDSFIFLCAAGVHKIDLFWTTGAANLFTQGTQRNLSVREI